MAERQVPTPQRRMGFAEVLSGEHQRPNRPPAAPKTPVSDAERIQRTQKLIEVQQEERPDSGVTVVENGTLAVQYRPRSMKRNGLLTPVAWDAFTVDMPNRTQEVYLERHPEHLYQVVGKISSQEIGVWKEVWSEPRGRKDQRVRLKGPERVGEESTIITKRLSDGKVVFGLEIYNQEAVASKRNEEAQQVAMQQKIMKEKLGDFGTFLTSGQWEGQTENPREKVDAMWVQAGLKKELNNLVMARLQNKLPQPKKYTNLTFGEKVKFAGQSVKELVLPKSKSSARVVGQSVLGAAAWEMFLLPTPTPIRIVAGIVTGINMATMMGPAFGGSRKLGEERNQQMNAAVGEFANKFKDFQAEYKDKTFIEQMKMFTRELYVETHRDRYEQLKFRNPNLSDEALIRKLKKRGIAKTVALAALPLGLAGFLGYSGISALVDNFGGALARPSFYDMYRGFGNLVHAGPQYLLAAGYAAYYVGMQGYAAITRVPDAITRARKKVQLKKEQKSRQYRSSLP